MPRLVHSELRLVVYELEALLDAARRFNLCPFVGRQS